MYLCVCVYVCVCVHNVYIHVCMCVCVYMCVYVCVCVLQMLALCVYRNLMLISLMTIISLYTNNISINTNSCRTMSTTIVMSWLIIVCRGNRSISVACSALVRCLEKQWFSIFITGVISVWFQQSY